MLAIKQSDCSNCASMTVLLEDIDCKLTELAKNLYNNVIFALNNSVRQDLFIDLMNYRRIITYRMYNSDYALPYTDEQIASKVKILKFK